jgi:hypothetical protein
MAGEKPQFVAFRGITYHFGISASGDLWPILIRKNLEIACYSCGFEPQNTEQGMSNFSRERLLNTVILSESAFYLQSIHQLQSTYRFEIRYSATCGGQLHSRDNS